MAKKLGSRAVEAMTLAAIRRYSPVFNLANPITLDFKSRKSYYGKHQVGFLHTAEDNQTTAIHHLIISTWYAANQRIVDITVAHELIHCWQAENGLECDHGESYRRWAGKLIEQFGIDPDATE